MRWIVAQEGSREHYAVPLALHRLGQLRRLYADIWCRWGRSWLRRGPNGARALAGRFNAGIPSNLVVSFSARAMLWRSAYYSRFPRLSRADVGELACRFGGWFARGVARELDKIDLEPGRDSFFGFNTASLEALAALRARGILTVLDQVDPGQVEERTICEESARWPGWESAPCTYRPAYWDRIRAEWDAADLVLVNSEWSAAGLVQQGLRRDKIIVVPLAIDPAMARTSAPVKAEGTLQVLWLGSLILRKGIQYLAEAARLLQCAPVEFLLAGPTNLSETAVRSFPPNMHLLGRLTRDAVREVYRRAHVFVLPTLSDGFAITQLEAMAQGLPVVTTPNCARVVTHGLDGFVVPARDSQALAEALATLDRDRGLLREMSRNALLTVRKYELPANARRLNELARKHADPQQENSPRV